VQNAVQRVSGAVVAQRAGELLVEGAIQADFAGAALTTTVQPDTLSEQIYERAAGYWSQNPVNLAFSLSSTTGEATEPEAGDAGFAQSVPGMGSMYVMFNVFAGMVALLQARKQWTLQRLATLPLGKWQILGGKMLARFLLGMIQFAVVFTVGYFLGLRYSSLLALLALMVAFVAAITALTFLLATIVGTEQQASAVSLFLALTLAPIGGAWWPLEIVPGWMQSLALVSPVGWVMRGFNDLMLYDLGARAVLVPVGVLAAAAVILFAAAVARFRYT
jgi:ABC-2 type transport system permease protein